ncbi:MAG: polynucleotide kinase [Demequina sp.]
MNDKPSAVLVDVDGTVALLGDRHPFDWPAVERDEPNDPVIEVVRALHAAGHVMVVVSGRSEEARAGTESWLARHLGVPFVGPHLRRTDDDRPDSVVKREIWDTHIEPHYDVLCALDDRNQSVDLWRNLGLTCLQVAPGDF